MPRSSNPKLRPFAARYLVSSLFKQLQDPGLVCLYGISFLIMGSFVTLYNYITFRLLAPPYALSHSAVSLIFLVYLLGSFSSSAAGGLAERLGHGRMLNLCIGTIALGAAVTLSADMVTIVAGIALFTCGFFGAHAIASGRVGASSFKTRFIAAIERGALCAMLLITC